MGESRVESQQMQDAEDTPEVFSKPGRDLAPLVQLVDVLRRRPCGLFLDIDGTISPIAPSPAEAQVSERCREQLRLLAERLALVAVISGRSAEDAERLVDVAGPVYVGNHGLERRDPFGISFHPQAQEYRVALASLLVELRPKLEIPGLLLEAKGLSMSIHYRRCPDPNSTRQQILDTLAGSRATKDFRITEGRKVIEVRPPVAVDKGTAVEALSSEYHLRGLIALGDDQTDVDAFRAIRRQRATAGRRGLAVGVLSPETPAQFRRQCDLTVHGVDGVERLLAWMARQASQIS
jgi:trehalose 6-phosphate phosphatase